MTVPLRVSIPHRLGRREARRRLETGLDRARPEIARYLSVLETRWEDDRLTFRAVAIGQQISGRLEVFDESVTLEIDLPWMLRLLGQTITRRVRGRGLQLLGKPPEGG